MDRKVFRCAVGTRVFAWAVIVGGLVAVIGLVTMVVRGLGSLPVVIVLLALAVFGMLYVWRFALHPRVVVDDRLWVINPLHTHILTADEVTDIRPGPNGLQVSHAEGVLEAWAVQKGSGALKKGRTRRADHVAAALLAALRGEVAEQPQSDSSGSESAIVDVPAALASDSGDSLIPAPFAGDESGDNEPGNGQPDEIVEPSEDPSSEAPSSEAPSSDDATDPDASTDADPVEDAPVARPSNDDAPVVAVTAPGQGDPDEDEPDEQQPDDDEDDSDEDLIIRRAHPDDLDTLVALEQEINTQALAHIFTTDEPFPVAPVTERWSQSLGDRSYKVRVAEIDGEPVGFVCYDAEQLHQIGLLPRHSGHGHGRSLIEYAVDDMAARGASTAQLQVLEDNADAVGFYRHLGWRETGHRQPCRYPPHPIELTMSFELDNESR